MTSELLILVFNSFYWGELLHYKFSCALICFWNSILLELNSCISWSGRRMNIEKLVFLFHLFKFTARVLLMFVAVWWTNGGSLDRVTLRQVRTLIYGLLSFWKFFWSFSWIRSLSFTFSISTTFCLSPLSLSWLPVVLKFDWFDSRDLLFNYFLLPLLCIFC